MTKSVLYLMFGYPGAGKTTTAKLIESVTGATRLSSDETRLELFPKPTFSTDEHDKLYHYLNTRCAELLKGGTSVIYDANLNRRQHRQEKYDIAKEHRAESRLIWVKTARELAKQRATHQTREHFVPQHETATAMFERIADVLESPTAEERPIIIDGSHVTDSDIQRITKS